MFIEGVPITHTCAFCGNEITLPIAVDIKRWDWRDLNGSYDCPKNPDGHVDETIYAIQQAHKRMRTP